MSFPTYKLTGIWADLLGEPEKNGCWMIWGEEKNGKTTIALMLANYMATVVDTVYISGEEGVGANFKAACLRAGIDNTSKLKVLPYLPLLELKEKLAGRRAPKVVVLDNITVYHEELKYGAFGKLMTDNPDTLFIMLAHEEGGKPYTSSAKLCSRYAKVKIHVSGLVGFVSGRCPGGTVTIDETKATLYHGNAIITE